MKYIINLNVVFSPDDKTLSLLNDGNQAIQLSNQSARLLLEMVTNCQETLHREDLLKRVWEDYGFTRSNNSLNVAVSEIRQSLKTLGGDPQIIITIPKVGFRFSANVHPTITEEKETNNEKKSKKETNMAIPDLIPEKKSKKILISIVILIILLLTGATVIKIKPRQIVFRKSEGVVFLYEFNKCKVYSLDTRSMYNHQDLVAMAKHDIGKEDINCSTGQHEIYYTRNRANNNLFQETFIGICTIKDDGNYSHCKTIKNFFRSN